MNKITVKVDNISCANCAKTIKNGLKDYEVDVNVNNSTVYIKGNNLNEEKILNQLDKIGYPKTKTKNKTKYELYLALFLSSFLLLGMFNHFAFSEKYIPDFLSNGYFQLVLASIVQFYVGRRFYLSAWHSLKQKVLGMDILVVISTTTAYALSVYILFTSMEMMPELYFETSALIITLIMVGKYIEERVKEKTNDAINELVNVGAKVAHKKTTDNIVDVDIEELEIGDVLVVYANEKIPIDSKLINGTTYVNEASFTGESKPIKKELDQHLIGGSINMNSKIEVVVEKVGPDTLLNQIIAAVEEASLVETKYQKLADKITGYFIPVVLTIAVLTYIVNFLLTNDAYYALFTALSVVLISCPCALGLATPTAIVSANGVSAKRGIMYKGGNFFELAYKIKIICFDKTGTLTTGELEVTNYQIPTEYNDLVYSISSHSNHPISTSVAKYLKGEQLKLQVEHLDGIGLKSLYNNDEYLIVNYKYKNLPMLENTGNYFLKNNELLGYYEVKDNVKPSAISIIANLKEIGITPVMITGDNLKVAKKVVKELGIEKYYAEVLPVDKSNIVQELQTQGIVGFVGDGVNDSVALTMADVGIAVNTGNDVAIKSSDVTLMTNNLNLILDGIKISKATNRNIKQNLFWAFSYNLFAIPLAASGQLNMYVAAISMSMSSLLVLTNALRLKRIKFDEHLIAINNVKINCDKCVAKITDLFEANNLENYKIDKANQTVYVSDYELAHKILKENGYVQN